MNCSTRNDTFLKENLEWVSKCTNWARFTATSSLGVIHMGNSERGLDVMKSFLPGGQSAQSIYVIGGAYYGVGLIFANTNDEYTLNILLEALHMPSNNKECIQHGIYLGIGLIAMGSNKVGM